MTTSATNQPVAIDYTSRDYYALREAMIERIKLRVPTWQGTDANDFGVALVESFAYLGDIVNYYIDRIANESYIYTATQRQNILNLATMFGYTPGGYVSANVDVTFSNQGGYKGQIGGSVLTSGIASIIIPNDNTFIAGDTINVSGMTRSEYNGNWVVNTNAVLAGTAKNTVTYIPSFTVIAATYSSGAATVVFEYTQPQGNSIAVNELVNVAGMTPNGYNRIGATVTAVGTNTSTGNPTITVTQGTSLTTATVFGTIAYSDIAIDASIVGTITEVGYTTVPAGTQLSADVSNENVIEQVLFTTLSDAVVPFGGIATVIAEQGLNVSTKTENLSTGGGDIGGELIGQSTGLSEQSFILKETVVDLSTIQVFVQRGSVYEAWTRVTYIEDYGSTDSVFSVTIDADEQVFVKFGDGISGAIPPIDSNIKATYIAGGGVIGNIPVGAIDSIYNVPGANSTVKSYILQNITVDNLVVGNGGAEPESDANIRYNAPRALRALNRAVTLQDFSSLALAVPNVAKATAVAIAPTSVTVFISPTTTGINDITPGFVGTAESSSLSTLRSLVASYLLDKQQIGTSVVVSPPSYINANVEISYTKYDQYSDASIQLAIKNAIFESFSYDNSDFGQTITSRDVEASLQSIVGIKNIKVTKLYRGSVAGLNTLVGASNELFVFTGSGVTFSSASNVATLSALVLNDGAAITLLPGFTPTVYNYLAQASTSLSLTITPTATATTNAAITVNGAGIASGGTITTSIVAGINPPIVITVVAQDGVTVANYVVTVTKV
jgi:hypothetical protein